jgi:hypothetical protein
MNRKMRRKAPFARPFRAPDSFGEEGLPAATADIINQEGKEMTDPITLKLADNIGHARGTDYFLMKEQLTAEEQEILSSVRKFGELEVLPIVNRYWERGEFPFELVPKIAGAEYRWRPQHAGARVQVD